MIEVKIKSDEDGHTYIGFGLGEVAEPEAKLEHKTLKLRTND